MSYFPQNLTSWWVILIIMHVFLLGVAYLILLERKMSSWAQDRVGPNRVGIGPLVRHVVNIVVYIISAPLLLVGIRVDPDAMIWQNRRGEKFTKFHLWGLGQPLADGIKFVAKEDYNPGSVDKPLFFAAPVLAAIPALLGWAVIPWGGMWESFPAGSVPGWVPLLGGYSWGETAVNVAGLDVNIGLVYILAIGSLSVYGIAVAGWAANNKYTFFGSMRGVAQILSYEIPLGLAVLCVILLAGSAAADGVLNPQVGYWFGVIPSWNVFQMPVVAILMFICILAETNRLPFDLAESEQELIGGFHTEYSSMKFALFFLAEYMHMLTGCAFFALLFLGGWHLPWVDYLIYGGAQPVFAGLAGVALKMGVFLGKVLLLIAVMIWVRWTLPRFRFDQLMSLAWRGLIPTALLLLLITGTFVYFDWTSYMWVGNLLAAAIVLGVAPFMPQPAPVNRKVRLSGSRYSPA